MRHCRRFCRMEFAAVNGQPRDSDNRARRCQARSRASCIFLGVNRMRKFTIAANFRRAQMARNEKCMRVANACTQYVHTPICTINSFTFPPTYGPAPGDRRTAKRTQTWRAGGIIETQCATQPGCAPAICAGTRERGNCISAPNHGGPNLVWCKIISRWLYKN